jgi:hypothetical protein
MSRSFLDLLPFETRSQIFRYVLSSPTGYITLSRTLYHQKPIRYKLLTLDESGSGCEVNKLSFLRTCSQIYEECRDLLWKYNTLDLVSYMHETSSPNLHSLREMPTGISYWARAVQMDYDFYCTCSFSYVYENDRRHMLQCNALLDVSQWPSLESITLNIRDKFAWDPSCVTYERFRDLLSLRRKAVTSDDPNFVARRDYYKFLDVLKAVSESTNLSVLKREMVINTEPVPQPHDSTPDGMGTFHESGFPTRFFKAWWGDLDEMLKKIKAAWGGSLIIDGIPRYESDDDTPMFVQLKEEVESEGEEVSLYQSDVMVQVAAYRYSTISKRHIKEILDEMSESKDFHSIVMGEWEIWKKSPDFEDYSITRKNRKGNHLSASYIEYLHI